MITSIIRSYDDVRKLTGHGESIKHHHSLAPMNAHPYTERWKVRLARIFCMKPMIAGSRVVDEFEVFIR